MIEGSHKHSSGLAVTLKCAGVRSGLEHKVVTFMTCARHKRAVCLSHYANCEAKLFNHPVSICKLPCTHQTCVVPIRENMVHMTF